MTRIDDLQVVLWRTLSAYDLEQYADALIDTLEAGEAFTDDWYEEDEEDES